MSLGLFVSFFMILFIEFCNVWKIYVFLDCCVSLFMSDPIYVFLFVADIPNFPINERQGTTGQEREEKGLPREEKAISTLHFVVQGPVD